MCFFFFYTGLWMKDVLRTFLLPEVGAYYAIGLFMTKTDGWPAPTQNAATGWLSSATAAFAGAILYKLDGMSRIHLMACSINLEQLIVLKGHGLLFPHLAFDLGTRPQDLYVVKKQRRIVDAAIFCAPMMLTLAAPRLFREGKATSQLLGFGCSRYTWQ